MADDALIQFRRALAGLVLGRIPVEEMPSYATQALSDGVEAPSLVVLAGMNGAGWSELRPVIEEVRAEVGGPAGEQEARALAADLWLQRLCSPDYGIEYEFDLTENVLADIGGEYEWFREALYDLALLESTAGYNELVAGRDGGAQEKKEIATLQSEMRQRAKRVLALPQAERLRGAPGDSE